jgi:spherulation-specific family 4 protein
VPAYFHPACDVAEWTRLASSGVALVVANIADGPGLFREKPWALALHDVRAAGSHIVGYVDTGYLGLTGQRTRLGSTLIDAWIEQILHDIDSWYRMYDDLLTGIFFDQVAESEDGASIVPVLRGLRERVRRLDRDALTVLNAGASVPASFAGIADILVTFEGPCETYLAENTADAYEPLSWVPTPGQLIWHIVHHTTDLERAAEVVSMSRSRGAGLLYMTDGDGENPYSTLPSPGIWAAASSNAGTLPIPPPRLRRKLRKPGAMAGPSSPVLSVIDRERELISNPRLIRDHDTIEASADFVMQSVCQRVFLASRRQDVPRWWTGSSPQIAADWLIENNRLYAYSGTGTDWTWTPAGQVIFEAKGSRSRWCLEADVIGVGMDADADAAFHVTAPGNREYSEVTVGCLATAT